MPTWTRGLRESWNSLLQLRPGFRVVFSFYQRESTYSLALTSLSACAKHAFPDLRTDLVSVARGDDPDEFAQKVARLNPDLLAITAMHPTWLPMLPFLEAFHALKPGTPVLVGGYQAIFSPEQTLGHPAVDYICVGDGEKPFLELIRRLRSDGANRDDPIPGMWLKSASGEFVKSAPVLTDDFENLPFPDYTIFERDGGLRWLSPHAIESKNLTTLPIMSGRGCPYKCSYCSNTSLLELYKGKGSFLRKYNLEKLIDEMVRLRDRYQLQYFQFMDETFSFDKPYAYRLLELYKDKVGLPFSFFARVEQIDDKFAGICAAAGCHSMWFGVESGSEKYRRRYLARKMTNERVVQATDCARRHGIKRMIFNMIGLPFETRENILETLELTRRIDPELAIFGQFLPLPGTPLYGLAKEAGLLLEPSEKQGMWAIGSLNIKEQPGFLRQKEFKELADKILSYLYEHNRYDDDVKTTPEPSPVESLRPAWMSS